MNRSAIEDLLGGIMSTWYESIAAWMPPGQSQADTCSTCRTSLLVECIDVDLWPHDLVHQLATTLESLTLQTYDSLVVTRDRSYQSVRDYVGERIRLHADDLVDVFRECVEPRVAEWATHELERGLAQVNHHS